MEYTKGLESMKIGSAYHHSRKAHISEELLYLHVQLIIDVASRIITIIYDGKGNAHKAAISVYTCNLCGSVHTYTHDY